MLGSISVLLLDAVARLGKDTCGCPADPCDFLHPHTQKISRKVWRKCTFSKAYSTKLKAKFVICKMFVISLAIENECMVLSPSSCTIFLMNPSISFGGTSRIYMMTMTTKIVVIL